MAVIERQIVIMTKDSDGNTILNFPVTNVKCVEGAVQTINREKPDASGNVEVGGGVPVGFEYISFNPNVPQGSLPLFGGTFSRSAYADLWEWVQTQTGYLISEAEWQTKATANNGNVPFYSDGDGSTTFRVPSLSCWVKGANGISEVGSYLEAGLPNITGTFVGGCWQEGGNYTPTGAFYSTKNYVSGADGGDGRLIVGFTASRSSSIYGNSDSVQPPSIVGMWLVKAFGTVSNVGNQDIADISAGLMRVENKMDEYTDIVAHIESFIVETWKSDDGSSWYRKYSDGWIEQGGVTPNVNADSHTVTLNTPFTTVNYHVNFITTGTGKDGSFGHCVSERTNTTFTMYDYLMNGVPVLWYACGY
jgi:hypothetical protein